MHGMSSLVNTYHTSVEHIMTMGRFVVVGLGSLSAIIARSYLPQQQILDGRMQPVE